MTTERFDTLSILIVDDIAQVRFLLRGVLRQLGVQNIREASGGDEAFEMICAQTPDVVISDWEMAGGSGLDLIRAVRRNPASPDPLLPVILLTGHGGRPQVEIARSQGVTDFIVKPFAPASVAARLRDLVDNQRSMVVTPDYIGPDRRRGRHPIQRERRRNAIENVTIIPPDGLLRAKIDGNAEAIKKALRKRDAGNRALREAANAPPGMSERRTLCDRIDAALSPQAPWPDSVGPILDSLRRVTPRIEKTLPPHLHHMPGQFLTFAASRARMAANPRLARLLLAVVRAILAIGIEPGAEALATNLTADVERAMKQRMAVD